MRHFAVVGSGPAGFYTAEALAKAYGDQARIDIIDRYPVPYGLIRFGVAPDHQSLKAVSKRYDKVAESAASISSAMSRSAATSRSTSCSTLRRGDPRHRRAARPQARHPRRGSARRRRLGRVRRLVQRPSRLRRPRSAARRHARGGDRQRQCRARRARILSKTRAEFEGSDIVGHALDALDASAIRTITILGRRGPHQIAMTPKELGELGHLEAAVPVVEPPTSRRRGRRRARARPAQVGHPSARVRRPAPTDKPKRMVFDFFAKPLAIEGDGKAERMIVERTELDEKGGARGTGETYEVPASLVVSCIGYSTRRSRASPMTSAAASSPTTAADRDRLYASAGRGAGRPGRSAPTGPTAMKSPSRSPPRCRRERRRAASARKGLEAPARKRGVMPTELRRLAQDRGRRGRRARPAARARSSSAIEIGWRARPLIACLRLRNPPSI
jgi:hypothetical protein